MATRYTQFATGEFYHIYNRGVEKRVIFKNAEDYTRFQQLLYVSNTVDYVNIRDLFSSHQNLFLYPRDEPLVAIGAYCLMPNHFHLLVTPLVEDGIAKFMNKLGTSYAMYFNKRNQRTGRLFEGTYKAKHTSYDEYLKYLFSYIHLNPVKLIQEDWKEQGIRNPAAALSYAQEYRFSSLQDLHNPTRLEAKVIDLSLFPEYFAAMAAVHEELLFWLDYPNFPQGNPREIP
jgi:putative transposase